MDVYRLTENEYQNILAFKRDLHMHPELSRREFETTGKIRTFLEELPDFEILPLVTETGTGVAARIRGQERNSVDFPEKIPEIMLRADIDALPQTEEYESPWKSQTPGIMHACGHDFHTASLLGAALLLQRAKRDGALPGTVDLVFQPAEEGTTGACMMIEAGLFDLICPDLCFGFHNWPSVESGKVVCREGALMSAKRNFEIRIYGKGGHGSMPHLNIDPIVCAAAVIQSLQTVVSRSTSPLDSVILTVNMIEGGSPANLVADQVRMLATVRSLSDDALDHAISRIESIVESTAKAYECRSEILWNRRIPSVWNEPEMTALASECAASAGFEVIDAEPSLASEDFSCYRAYVPSFFYWIGSTPAGEPPQDLHKPRFHTDDSVLQCAAELFMASVMYSSRNYKLSTTHDQKEEGLTPATGERSYL